MSRTDKWIIAISVLTVLLAVVAIVGLFIWPYVLEKRWTDFKAHWEAQGESFEIAAHMPEAIEDSQNFAKHPWLEAVRTNDEQVMERLNHMKLESLPAFDEWLCAEKLVMMPEPLARQVLDYCKPFAADFDALSEAATRPGFRVELDYESGIPLPASWLSKLSPCCKALSANAAAALALGDEDTFTNQIILLLDIGHHLRANNTMLITVVGCGFEGSTYQMIRDLTPIGVKKETNRSRLIDAINRRKRPLGEEMAKVLRLERAMALKWVDIIESESTTSPIASVHPRKLFGRVYFATNRLALCEDSQRILFAPEGRPKQEVGSDDVERYDALMRKRRQGGNPLAAYLEAIASAHDFTLGGVGNAYGLKSKSGRRQGMRYAPESKRHLLLVTVSAWKRCGASLPTALHAMAMHKLIAKI